MKPFQILGLIARMAFGLCFWLPPPAIGETSDDCANATVMIPGVTYTVNTANATEIGDPNVGCATNIGRGVWYVVTPRINQRVTISTCGSDFDTRLAVYTGTCGALAEFLCSDNYGPYCTFQASASFNSGSNTNFYVLVGGSGPNAFGNLQVSLALDEGQTLLTKRPMPQGADVRAVNSSLNRIYVSSGFGPGSRSLVVVDGDSFAQTEVGIGNGASVDSVNNNNYWVTTLFSGSAIVRSGVTDATVTNLALGFCPSRVSVDATHRRAWVNAQCGGGDDPVWAIDADTFAVVAGPIGSGGVHGDPFLVNPATGKLYMNVSGVPKRVNPAGFAVTLNSFGPVFGVNPRANLLYAQGLDGSLQIINGAPDPEVVLANVTLPFALSGNYIGVNPLLNRIYVANPSAHTIVILDGMSGQILGTVDLGAEINAIGSIAVDTSRNRVYATAWTPDASYFLYVIQDRSLYEINVSSSPTAGGLVTGGGYFTNGAPVAVAATAINGFGFVGWTEGESLVTTSSTYGFTAGANRMLVANFTNGLPQVGSITVTILPTEAVSAGAQWRIVGDAIWLASGAVRANLPLGTNQIEFRPISGWITPQNRPFTLTAGARNIAVTSDAEYLSVLGQSVFSNPNRITIRDNDTANPYPATIVVSGLAGLVQNVTVSLIGLSHSFPDDINVLLVAPDGKRVMLMANAGGKIPVAAVGLDFSDGAASTVTDAGPITPGNFKPTSYAPAQTLPSPAPSGPYGSLLSAFNGMNPNGTWSLYVIDDSLRDSGSIEGGWSLSFQINLPPLSFANASKIAINDNGAGSPYPSTIIVSGLVGKISKTVISLNGVTHPFPDDIDVLLVSPDAKKVLVMSNAGGGQSANGLNNAQLIIDDSAASAIPDGGPAISGVRYKPSNFGSPTMRFASPAPVGPYATVLSEFNGIDGNGKWSLYVMDDTLSDFGAISNGWSLTFQTQVFITGLANQSTLEDVPSVQPFTLVHEAGGAYAVVASSSDQSIVANANISFSGSVTDTNRTLKVTPNRDANGGPVTITVTATPLGESPSSVTFMLTVIPVNDAPTFTPAQIADQSTIAGVAKEIVFDVMDAETPTRNLIVQAHSSNQSLLPDANLVPRLIAQNDTQFTLLLAPSGSQNGRATVTVTASDGTLTTSNIFSFTVNPSDTLLFANTNAITIRDGNTANPYPSTIAVANVAGDVTRVIVTLVGFTHKFPDDVDILLVGPFGQKAVLMSDAGGGNSLSNARIVLDSAASADIPDNNPISSGTFRPTDYEVSEAEFPAPAPAGLIRPAATAFLGTNPNGVWTLYVVDDTAFEAGSIQEGWLLNILTTAPLITGLADVTIPEDTVASLPFTLFDPDTDLGTLRVDATSNNSSLVSSIAFAGSGANRIATITPVANQYGSAIIQFTVTDGVNTTTKTAKFMVTPVDDPPILIELRDKVFPISTFPETSFAVTDVDTAAANITVTASASNTNMINRVVLSSAGGVWTAIFIRGMDQIGSTTVTFVVSDGGASTILPITVTFDAVNQPPTINSISTQTTIEDVPVDVAFSLTDIDTRPESLEITATSSNLALLPVSSMTFKGTGPNRTATLTPALNQSGISDVTISVTDGTGVVSTRFLLLVNPVNDLPTITPIADVTVDQGNPASVAFSINDVEVLPTNLSVAAASSNPRLIPVANIVLSPGIGLGNWIANITPVPNQFGTSTVTLTVFDGTLTTSRSFTVTVKPVNEPPFISLIPDDQRIDEDHLLIIPVVIFDPESQISNLSITFTSSNENILPANNIALGGSGTNRTILLLGTANAYGLSIVNIRVSDGTNTTVFGFSVTIFPVNDAPSISGIPAAATTNEDEPFTLNFTVADVDNDVNSLTLLSVFPAIIKSVTFSGSGASRTALITPAANANGTTSISIIAGDGSARSTNTFVFTVRAVNDPPTIDAIQNQVFEANKQVTIAFRLSDIDTPLSNLVVGASASNMSLFPDGNLVVTGNGTAQGNRSLILTPAIDQTGNALINVFVTDGTTMLSYSFVINVTSVSFYAISVSAAPTSSGTVSGGGSFTSGANVTVVANPANGSMFVNWTESGSVVSTSAIYQFSVNRNRTLVANFTAASPHYTITVTASPTPGGTVSGGGSFAPGSIVPVVASPANGYSFVNWTERGNVASTSASYQFIATADRTLVANFANAPPPPTGSITVTILPQAAINEGAQWMIVGDSVWLASGATRSNLELLTEPYTIEFKPIPGWITPPNNSFRLSAGSPNLSFNNRYCRQFPRLLSQFVISDDCSGAYAAAAVSGFQVRGDLLSMTLAYQITSTDPTEVDELFLAIDNRVIALVDAYIPGTNPVVWQLSLTNIPFNVVSPGSHPLYLVRTASQNPVDGRAQYEAGINFWRVQIGQVTVPNRQPAVKQYVVSDESTSAYSAVEIRKLDLVRGVLDVDLSFQIYDFINQAIVFDNGVPTGFGAVNQLFLAVDRKTFISLYHGLAGAYPGSGGAIQQSFDLDVQSTLTAGTNVFYAVRTATTSIDMGRQVYESGGGWRTPIGSFVVFGINASVLPGGGGTASGGGKYVNGEGVNLFAAPSSNYDFVNWTEDGQVQSTSAAFSFVASTNRNLVANFVARDDRPAFTFEKSVYPVSEASGFVDIVIRKFGGKAGAVSYATQEGTAFAASQDGLGDFVSVQGSINLPAGDATATNRIKLIDDSIFRQPNPRTFTVSIQASPDSALILNPSTAQISILDDDSPLTSTLATGLPRNGPGTGWLNTGWMEFELDPTEAGGGWRFPWELDWRSAGEKSGPLESGTYPVEFMPRDGYQAPPSMDIFLPAGSTAFPLRVHASYSEIPLAEQRFGSLRVMLFSDNKPSTLGRWRLRDRANDPWRLGGALFTGVLAGLHVLEFEEVPGYETPLPRVVTVPGPGETSVISANYQASEQPLPLATRKQLPLTSEEVQRLPPFTYCGQLVTDAGFASGILVRPRVVLTAAHVLFRPGTTNPVQTVRWFFERHKGFFEPRPLIAQGWYIPTNYLNAIANEPRHDGLSVASRESDIAAVYFAEDAGRGGYSGYLVSDSRPDQWLQTQNAITFVGYPFESTFSGQMHAELSLGVQFRTIFGGTNVLSTAQLGGLPGASGGPLCIQSVFTGQLNYYPAAVFLGQSGDQALFRVIDHEAATLIERAELSSYTGRSHVGGGILFLALEILARGNRTSLKVILSPDAFAAGIGWRLRGSEDRVYKFAAESVLELPAGNWLLEFTSNTSGLAPGTFPITLDPNQELEVTVGYSPVKIATTRFEADGRLYVLIKAPPAVQVRIDSSLDLRSWQNQVGGVQTTDLAGEAEFRLTVAPSRPAQYFRARVQ